ncbi:DUF3352 domain-containing protein [Carboxylicivirga caseinilyticus]|uniref:DUF3352 domain-containing protein n=1 Tax=Carboxylicivirga caseinilyticus TaxID=3417572 RepID=UPI003D34521D|nr:DUF3352 domain-containing protein [Marinilabiliaceae bacterium A049]
MKIVKYFLLFIAIIVLAILGFFIYLQFIKVEKLTPLQAIQPESVIVIETKNLTSAWREIKNSELWESMIEADYFDEYEANMMIFDSLMTENALIRSIFKDRPMALSIQMLNDKDFETVFAVDIGKYGKLSILPQLSNLMNYQLEERIVDSTSVYTLCYDQPTDIIHLCIHENLLIGSLSSQLINKTVKAINTEQWFNHDKFNEVQNETASGMVNFYINYSQIANFAGSIAPELKESLKSISKVLAFSSLVTHLEDKNIRLSGYTNYYDSIPSIVNALVKADGGKLEAQIILPAETALFMSINTSNFQLFYNDILAQYKLVDSIGYKTYLSGIEMTENWLNLEFNDILFSWMDGEFALAKLQPQSNARELDVLMAIKANDIDNAKEQMNLFLKHIKKRTPVKFDEVEYRNHQIHFLQMKGFFKMFLGKFMNGIEKPYFTYIDNYVVFSNSVNTLMNTIDDYLVGNTIARSASFKSFFEEFNDESNFSLFVQMPKVYQHLYYYSDANTKKSLKKNKNLLINFTNIGWQLNANGQMFETKLLAQHDEDALLYEELEAMQNAAEDLYIDEYRDLKFKMRLDDTFPWNEGTINYWLTHPQNVQDSVLIHEGEMKDSLPQGLWRNYYFSGNISSAIPYDDGKADGTAIFYFEDDEHTVKAEVDFDDDVLDGKYIEYYSNGRKKAELILEDGLLDGDAFYYYRNGQIKIEGRYKNGLRHGKWKHYTKAGDLINKESWNKGKE